jgi:iron complex outermembrane recepter protein
MERGMGELTTRLNSRTGVIRSLLGLAVAMSGTVFSPFTYSSAAIEEIVVTARKRDESIQDVPISVSALDKELKQSNVRRLEDIQNYAPNVQIRRTPGIASGAAISIRGVSSDESDKSLDPAIGVMMDGMFLGTPSGVLLQNFDIKRIEVLRGPQGILFGKNTTGGLINVIRGDVTMELGADVNIIAGNDGREDVKAVVNLPLIDDKLGVKLFGASIQSDGFMRNTTLNKDVGGDDIVNYGFTTLWRPADNFDLKFHYEKFKDESEQGVYTNENYDTDLACTLEKIGFSGIGCASSSNDDENHTASNGTNFSDNEYDTYIVTANWDLDKFLLTYIGTSRDMDENNMQDFDGAPVDMLRMQFFNDWQQESHEFRVTSQFSNDFEFVAGVYRWDVDYEQRWDVYDLFYQLSRLGVVADQNWTGPVPTTATTASSNGQEQATESTAVFFSGDWHVSEKWTLSAGFRWTEEEKKFIGGNGGVFYDAAAGDPIPPLFDPQPYKGKWNETTPMVGFRYQHSDDIMFFGSYSEGFKSGGFFGRQADFNIDPSYEPEFVENFEIGMKSTFLDGRMIFNPAIFLAKYKDKQESILVPVDLTNVATVVRNASQLDMFGVELELQFQVTDAWYLRGTYGYIDSEYDNYLADLNGDGIVTDNSGLTPRNTPENTFGLTTTYTIPVGEGDLMGLVSYRWRDKLEAAADNDPRGQLDSIDSLSATLSYAWSDERYRVTAWGRNLTDEREKIIATIGGITTRGWWNEGRTYGVELSASF